MARRKGENVDVGAESSQYRAKKSDDVLAKKAKAVEHNLRPETVVIAGSARLPENITAKHVFGYVTIELEIDPVDDTIFDVSCTLLPFVEKKILYQACLGNKIDTGIEKAIEQLDKRFFGTTKKPIINALKDAYRRYKKSLKAARNTV